MSALGRRQADAYIDRMSRKAEKTESRSDPLAAVLLGAAIVVLTLIVHAPAMTAGFIWDDDGFLTANPLIHAPDGLQRFWFTRQAEDYYPLTYSMLWLEWRIWRMNAPGYHVVNILLHAGAALLLWRVLKRLKIPAAWLGAALFAVHPVAITSVAWIAERKNTLCIVFYLASVLMYLRFEDSKRWSSYAWALGLFLLALLSKSAAVVLPPALALCIWWRGGFSNAAGKGNARTQGGDATEPFDRAQGREIVERRVPPPRRQIARHAARLAPFFALALLFGVIQLEFHRVKVLGNPALVDDPALTETYVRKNVTARPEGFFSRLAASGWAAWFYLGKDVFPYPVLMTYSRWTVDPGRPVVWIPLTALLGVFLLLWRFRRSWGKHLLFGLGYFIIAVGPMLGFFENSYMEYTLVADHWQYFALPGVTALFAGFLGWAWRVRAYRPLLGATGTFALVALGVLGYLHAETFESQETLWRHNLKHNPGFAVGHVNLGNALLMRGDHDGAIREYEVALRLDPNSPLAAYNLGVVRLHIYSRSPDLSRKQKIELLDSAIKHLRNRMSILPDKETKKYLDSAETMLEKLKE